MAVVFSGMETITILQSAATLLVALLAGSMLFFSFVMAPLIFIKLEINVAGGFVRAVFPWYYLLTIALTAVPALLLLTVAPLNAGLLTLVAASAVYCRQSLMPAINDHRDRALAGDQDAGKGFDRLHKRSEILNGLQILAVMAVLIHLILVDFS